MKKLLKYFGAILLAISIFSFIPKLNEWKTYFENDQIKIESSIFSCDKPSIDIHNDYVILKVTNKTDKVIDVSFKKELYYNETCTSCGEGDEFTTKISIQPNQILEANCDSKTKDLKIFHSNKNSKKILTKFELKNITINLNN
jgi:hypothetical protein